MTSAESQQSLLIMLRVQLSFVVVIFVSFYYFTHTGRSRDLYSGFSDAFRHSRAETSPSSFVFVSFFCQSDLSFQASTPYSLESESLRVDCIMSGGASPTLAINAVTNKVGCQ